MIGSNTVPHHKKPAVTMFPTAHDVTSVNAVSCYRQVGKILASGDNVLVVSKASLDPLRIATAQFVGDIGVESRIEVRVTIGSAYDDRLSYWEPGAPKFTERITALKWAHDNGFPTSVSMEPMLDAYPSEVIDAVTPYVSPDRGIWLGRANRLMQTVAVNCPGDAEAKGMAQSLNRLWSDDAVMRLYAELKGNPLIRWKDSIMAVVDKRK